MSSTVCFPEGNIAPGGCVIKSTAIDPAALDEDGVYRLTGRARVFTSESDAIATIKGQSGRAGRPRRRGRPGRSRAARHRDGGDLPADLRAPVSPLRRKGRPRHGRTILGRLHRSVHRSRQPRGARGRADRAARRRGPDPGRGRPRGVWSRPSTSSGTRTRSGTRPRLRQCSRRGRSATTSRRDPRLPADTVLWSRLQSVSGGLWGGCVYDVEAIVRRLSADPVAAQPQHA